VKPSPLEGEGGNPRSADFRVRVVRQPMPETREETPHPPFGHLLPQGEKGTGPSQTKTKRPAPAPSGKRKASILTSAKLGSVRRRCARGSSFRRAPDTQALPWPWRPARRTPRAG